MHESVRYAGAAGKVLEQLRRACLAYPESQEVEQFGHPWFKAGKRPFVVFGGTANEPAIGFATTPMDQHALCQQPGFFPTPYMHQHGWTSMSVKGSPDWALVEELIETAYRNVALQRMLKALDGAPRRG